MRILFVTGTNTGVGKTVVTGLLTAHLAAAKANFLALKPFCSGERDDALLLWELQQRQLSLDEINPFFFPEPLAPATAARRAGRSVSPEETLSHLRKHAAASDLLVIEGAGGLLSPLGLGFNAADLVTSLHADVILVAGNCLGVLNHTALSVDYLRQRGITRVRIALVDLEEALGLAAKCNEEDLRLMLPSIPLTRIPFIHDYDASPQGIRKNAAFLRTPLEELAGPQR